MVPLGPLKCVLGMEIFTSSNGSAQVLAGKAENAKRREIALSAFSVNWWGAVIPLLLRKLPEEYTYRNNQNFISRRKSFAGWSLPIDVTPRGLSRAGIG